MSPKIRIGVLSLYLHILVFCFVFYNSHSNGYEMISHCVLICSTLMISDVDHLFICLLVLREMSMQVLCPFFNRVVFIVIRLYEFFIYSGH